MDLSRLLQMLRQEREGQSSLLPTSLLRALKATMRQRSRTRRNTRLQALDRPESLEVRQVLSAVDHSTPFIGFEETYVDEYSEKPGLVAVDLEGVSFPIDAVQHDLRPGGGVVQMVRDQLSKSLSASNLMLEMSNSGETGRIPNKASTNRGQFDDAILSNGSIGNSDEVAVPGISDSGLAEPIFGTSGEPFNLSFLIEYSDGPQEVTIETISSANLQIRVSGLAGTIYESSGTEFTAQVLYQNAIEVLQRVQPTRPFQILFPSASFSNQDRIPTVPGASVVNRLDSSHGPLESSAVSGPQAGSDPPVFLPESQLQDLESQSAANATQDDSSLIDQVFSFSELTLDTSVVVRLGVNRLQQTLAWSRANSNSVILQQQEISAATADLKHVPAAVPCSLTTAGTQSGLARLIRRGLGLLRTGRFHAAGLISDAVFSEFITRVADELRADTDSIANSQCPAAAAESVEWLSWLLRRSSESTLQPVVGTRSRIDRSEFVPDAVPVFTDAIGSSRGTRGTWNTQTQIRKYREQHRYASSLNGAICVTVYEHDLLRVPQSTSIPQELKYVANPRGPPVYGRDADVPLLEVDAPADLLERLRYSIAPRGPSLATVETQSPDFTFSSGPRMSPEKVSTELAI